MSGGDLWGSPWTWPCTSVSSAGTSERASVSGPEPIIKAADVIDSIHSKSYRRLSIVKAADTVDSKN